MTAHKAEKAHKNHKFPHLQNEVDGILQNFDVEAYGEFEDVFDEEMKFTHIDTEEVMNGHVAEVKPKVRRSVVELSKAKELRQREKQEARLRAESVKAIHVNPSVLHQSPTHYYVKAEVNVKNGKMKITRIFALVWKFLRF